MSSLTSVGFWELVLAGGLRLGGPIGIAALGELIGQRSGVLNLGVEGTMALGALAGVAAAAELGPLGGLLAGAAVGAAAGALFALLVVRWHTNEVVTGFAFALGGVALATFLFRTGFAVPPVEEPFRSIRIPVLADVPLLGAVLFDQLLVVWLLPVSLVVARWVLSRTRLGLELRSAGEGPDAARARGVPVDRRRFLAAITASSLGGLGGAILAAGIVGEFSEQIVGGRGFVALALVIAAQWRPMLLLPAAWGIGSLQAFQLRAQTVGGLGLPVELLQVLPFLITLAVLALGVSTTQTPRALGRLAEEVH